MLFPDDHKGLFLPYLDLKERAIDGEAITIVCIAKGDLDALCAYCILQVSPARLGLH